MQLTQSEIIQILRKRAGFNQAELGSRAFETTLDSGRTKIKNIELGKQRPSDDDLKRIAQCLDVPLEQLQAPLQIQKSASARIEDGYVLSNKVVDMFPDLAEYLEMFENASRIDDFELLEYLSKKIAGIWQDGPILAEQLSSKTTTNSGEKANRVL